jgi:ribosomal protein L30/L7E
LEILELLDLLGLPRQHRKGLILLGLIWSRTVSNGQTGKNTLFSLGLTRRFSFFASSGTQEAMNGDDEMFGDDEIAADDGNGEID